MTLKRSQFSTTFVLIALFAVTAALQLLSAYGAVCVAWDPAWYNRTLPPFAGGGFMFAYVHDNLLLFQVSNIITWLGVILWAVVIYLTLTQKKLAYWLALATSGISFVFGLIPALYADTKDFTVPFELGSPHWARTFANGLCLILLVIPPVFKSLLAFTATENQMTGNIARQIMVMSLFFFWLSIVSFLGTNFMAGAHVVSSINIWQLVEIQTIGSYVTSAIGISMLGGGLIVKQFMPSHSVTTSVELNK
ncbi:MAG: hypothetical protein ACTSYU_00100 [Promethearchaeota archaeon]